MKNKKAIIMILSLLAIAVVIYFLFFYKKAAPAESSFRSIVPGVRAWQLPKGMSKIKLTTGITNKPQGCPQGSHQTQLADGTFSCVANTN